MEFVYEYNFYDFIKNFNAINFCTGTEYGADSLVDLKTGVNYIFAYSYAWNYDHKWDISALCEAGWGYGWGYGYGYGGLSPRLNADGKPYISTLEEIKAMCREYIKNSNKNNLKDGMYNFYLSDGLYQITLENHKFRTTIDAGKPVE